MSEIITPELLRSWDPCADGYHRFCELFPDGADLETAINGLVADGHDDWAHWLFCRCRERNLFGHVISRGYRNSGYQNSGYRNSGDWNSGYRNSGYRNSGNRNSGDRNSGNRNSGDRNSGNRNSGDWNSGDWNAGFLCSCTPDTILVFDRPCARKAWEAAYIPRFMLFGLTLWVDEVDMTEDEKKEHPSCSFTGGYLRVLNYKEAWRLSWDRADPADRERVRDLPNFDAQVFFEISGIDLREAEAV